MTDDELPKVWLRAPVFRHLEFRFPSEFVVRISDFVVHEAFRRQARTRSSTEDCWPSEDSALRTASWASICLKPRAINARTASLTFWSSGERARWALRASQAPAAPTLSLSSTTMRSAVFLPTPEICDS